VDALTAPVLFLVAGLFLVAFGLLETVLERLPLSASTLYLAIGVALGPLGFAVLSLDPTDAAPMLERVTEIAVIISLFSAGLKLRLPFRDLRWRLPLRLAFGAMAITVALVAAVGVFGLGLPLGAAILLGAVLAPTDPVLASAVQVSTPTDRDRVRFTLTGEAGLNDGTAFPFVMLGLGLLGLHEIGAYGWRWVLVDVVWAVVAGIGTGLALGAVVARLVLRVRLRKQEAVGTDDFLALGLIAASYGLALLLHAYGFLAVFAAGLALGRVDAQASRDPVERDGAPGGPSMRPAPEDREALERAAQSALKEADAKALATGTTTAPAFLAQAVLGFSEQLERIGEVGLVVLVGSMITLATLAPEAIWFVPLLFLVIRPLAVVAVAGRLERRTLPRGLLAWLGVRGIGSLYYLAFAIAHDLPRALADRLVDLTLATIAASVVVHGISVTPLMNLYQKAQAPSGRRRGLPE
jgi:sodium/hydrogen antiporter